jgi:hypothetical protein
MCVARQGVVEQLRDLPRSRAAEADMRGESTDDASHCCAPGDPLFERLDPLTDSRRRHMQPLGGRVEAARFDGRCERGQLMCIQACLVVVAHGFIVRDRAGRPGQRAEDGDLSGPATGPAPPLW